MTEINVGDRVRLTVEGVWGETGWRTQEGELTGFLKPTKVVIQPDDVVTIEKVVEPIQDGDKVRVVMEGTWRGSDVLPGELPVDYRGQYGNESDDVVTIERL